MATRQELRRRLKLTIFAAIFTFLVNLPKTDADPNYACPLEADVAFILDQSTSIVAARGGFDNWYHILGFVTNVVNVFPISLQNTQVGVVKFSEQAEVEFYLHNYTDAASLDTAIQQIDIEGGETNIAAALRITRTELFSSLRRDRPDFKKIAILLTDGSPNREAEQTLPEAELCKDAGIEIYTVGITNRTNSQQLRQIASEPADSHFYYVANFQELGQIVGRLTGAICLGEHREPQQIDTETTTTTSAPVVIQPSSIITTAGANITFHRQGERGLFGKNVTLQHSERTLGGQRSFIDWSNPVAGGTLKAFYVYVKNLTTLAAPNNRIRLQIWRTADHRAPSVTLVYEQLVEVQAFPEHGALYTFQLTDGFQVRGRDFLGWTIEGGNGPISYRSTDLYRTFYLIVPSGEHPQLLGNYTIFQNSDLYVEFSIAALIEPDIESVSTTTLQSSDAATVPSTTSQSSGSTNLTFARQGDRNLYGNNVTLRQTYLPETGQRSFVDVQYPLPNGILNEFYVYIHNVTTLIAPSNKIRLQIWRPADLNVPSMTLVYEHLLEVHDYSRAGKLYRIQLGNSFQVLSGDYLGWTNEGDDGPISFEYTVNHQTLIYSFPAGQYPQLQQIYDFDEIYFPATFSIAAVIEQGIPTTLSTDTSSESAWRTTRPIFLCSSDQFRCKFNDMCISKLDVCNGYSECGDYSDEIDCTTTSSTSTTSSVHQTPPGTFCGWDDFRCVSDGKCVPNVFRCDSYSRQCEDLSDELECWNVESCSSFHNFRCRSNGMCLNSARRCDSYIDCEDGSDEELCEYLTTTPIPLTPICKEDEFRCRSTLNCIPSLYQCDGDNDCGDYSDEEYCTCGKTQFRCQDNGRCLSKYKRCDGVFDCYDYSDEYDCNCSSSQFRCKSSGRCISYYYQCNGRNDCGDYSDEENCTCKDTDFRCKSNGVCFDSSNQCSGYRNCEDLSDESNCTTCSGGLFHCSSSGRCIHYTRICDGFNDCGDNTDELYCARSTQFPISPTTTTPDCSAHNFQCKNGRCVAQGYICDGGNDCGDWSDEENCVCTAEKYRCRNGLRCIDRDFVCDGYVDCSDRSDEKNCNCTSEQFRCGDGQCVNTTMRCDGEYQCFDRTDEANCICKSDQFKCLDTGLCISSSKRCNTVPDCYDYSDENFCNCSRSQFQCVSNGRCFDKSLRCDGTYYCADRSDEKNCTCTEQQYRCRNTGTCKPRNVVCNGYNDCGDFSDEENCVCSAPQFRCVGNSIKCIDEELVCDEYNDCGDYSDEKNCTCTDNQFRCVVTGMCVSLSKKCDENNDCGDYSDEIGCTPPPEFAGN